MEDINTTFSVYAWNQPYKEQIFLGDEDIFVDSLTSLS